MRQRRELQAARQARLRRLTRGKAEKHMLYGDTRSDPETVMNRFDRQPMPAQEAQVQFLDGDFRVVKPGTFVRCAISQQPIPLDELRYWDVDRQEAYATPQALLARLGIKPKS